MNLLSMSYKTVTMLEENTLKNFFFWQSYFHFKSPIKKDVPKFNCSVMLQDEGENVKRIILKTIKKIIIAYILIGTCNIAI